MTTFIKYLLINLLIFGSVVALVYWITKPSAGTAVVSATGRQQFIADANKVQGLYNQFKNSMETDDASQHAQDKVNLEQQLSIMETSYGNTSSFGRITNLLNQNYKRLITLHEASSTNKSVVNSSKERLKKTIQNLEQEISQLNLQLAIRQSQQ